MDPNSELKPLLYSRILGFQYYCLILSLPATKLLLAYQTPTVLCVSTGKSQTKTSAP